jgi:anti-anti-sigma regulatory factor
MAAMPAPFGGSSAPFDEDPDQVPWFSVEASAVDTDRPVITAHGEADMAAAPDLSLFDIEVDQSGLEVSVRANGDLDLMSIGEFRLAIADAFVFRPTRLFVDLAAAPSVSASAMEVLRGYAEFLDQMVILSRSEVAAQVVRTWSLDNVVVSSRAPWPMDRPGRTTRLGRDWGSR